jgi:hypothetical protein
MSKFTDKKLIKYKPTSHEASEPYKIVRSSDYEGIYGRKSSGSNTRCPKAKHKKMAEWVKQYTIC